MSRRILSQTLNRHFLKSKSFAIPFIHRRNCSSGKAAEIIEIDLSESSNSSSSSSSAKSNDGVEVLRKLEDLIHRIIVQRATPDWLPFVPGSSFWVPSTPRYTKESDTTESSPVASLIEIIGKLPQPLSEEEQLSFRSSRGWPSSAYFITGKASITHPVLEDLKGVKEPEEEMKVVVEFLPDEEVAVKVPTNENRSQSDHEEG